MDVIIRRADISNLKDIQELNNKLFELEYKEFDPSLKVGWPYEKEGTEYFSDMLNNEVVFIAEANNKIVGYLAGSINVEQSYNTRTLAELDNMYILEEYRKYGIGSKLVNELKTYCRSLGIQELKVTASYKNINAINFYRKNGFEDFDLTLKMEL